MTNESLQNLLRQKPNRRIPLIPFSPYVYVYHFGEKRYDQEKLLEEKEAIIKNHEEKIKGEEELRNKQLSRKKTRKLARIDKALEEGNIWMRWGEQLAVYDSSSSEKSADQIRLFLNSKGFFNAEADYSTKKARKYITTTYHVKEGKAHTIDTIFYSIKDSAVYKLIKKNESASLLEKNSNYDADKFSEERDRLDNLFKNNGYYDFTKQYIEFNIDTTLSNEGVAVEMVVHDPPKRNHHKSFVVDSVIFTTDASIANLRRDKRVHVYNNVTYQSFSDRYSKRILDRRLFIHPGDVYSRENTFETQKQLANLDMFKFINVFYDTTGGKTIANITTSPLKKYQTSNEVGLTVIQGIGNWPGPMFNSTLKNRNIFGGMEIFELSVRAGIEGVAAATESRDIYRSQEYGVNASLIFPQFLFPLGEKSRATLGRMNPRTRVLTGYSFTNRPEYQREILKSSITYLWQKEQKIVYNFTLADINLINSNIKIQEFEDRLRRISPALARSFEPSFVSSMIFSTTFNFNRYGSFMSNNSSMLKLYLESGGTTLNFLNQSFVEEHIKLQTFQFIRFYSDFRRYLPHPSGNSFAYRINTGFALPYGDNKALPYEKYFFAGGSNSIRAWRPRRLGPGSFTPNRLNNTTDENGNANGIFDYRFEQTGEILLEASLEWRRNLVGFLDGAIFVDAGNIWTFNEETERIGGRFEIKDFYKEIAVGTGVGFRFDFTFLLVRLDIGTKLYDPAREEGERFVLGNIGVGAGNYNKNREPLILNIGIGYPF